MNTILTDDEIEDAWCKYGDEMGGADQSDALRIGREIEAAVLAKLAQQEPVAYVPEVQLKLLKKHGKQAVVLHDKPAACGLDAALYTHPAPQQADRQRVPAEDSPAVCDAYERIDRFLRNNLGDEDYADYSHDLDLLSAALAQKGGEA